MSNFKLPDDVAKRCNLAHDQFHAERIGQNFTLADYWDTAFAAGWLEAQKEVEQLRANYDRLNCEHTECFFDQEHFKSRSKILEKQLAVAEAALVEIMSYGTAGSAGVAAEALGKLLAIRTVGDLSSSVKAKMEDK